jgi:predicted phosphodiesterase
MQQVFRDNPEIGRLKLAAAAGVPPATAQRFLKKQKGTSIPRPENDRYRFLDDLSPHEVERLRQAVQSTPAKHEPAPVAWAKSSFKFAFITDTHIGHQLSHRTWWDATCDLVAREKCDFALHAGDITEGMSGRPGHCYELAQIGMGAQVKEAVERFRQFPVPIKGITGNHDGWCYKAVGADPGAMIAESLPGKFEYLGMDEADIEVQGVKIKLWHGGDGSSYATSYRTQKFVEGLTGGEKPHILLSGHAHKSVYHMCRNVMVFEGGTLCGQTGWMRGKKLSAHTGFWIIKVWPAPEGGIERLQQQWVPFFK